MVDETKVRERVFSQRPTPENTENRSSNQPNAAHHTADERKHDHHWQGLEFDTKSCIAALTSFDRQPIARLTVKQWMPRKQATSAKV